MIAGVTPDLDFNDATAVVVNVDTAEVAAVSGGSSTFGTDERCAYFEVRRTPSGSVVYYFQPLLRAGDGIERMDGLIDRLKSNLSAPGSDRARRLAQRVAASKPKIDAGWAKRIAEDSI